MADAVVSEKQCGRCGEVKVISNFATSLGKPRSTCRACISAYNKAYREQNIERIRPRKILVDRAYAAKNADKARERAKKWYWDNRERSLAKSKAYRAENSEHLKAFDRNRNKTRPAKYQPQRNEKTKQRYRSDDKLRVHMLMSANMRHSLKHKVKNGRSWLSLVPYTKAELKKRLLKTMPEGYTWADFMAGKLHIDHIIPVSVFNFTCPEDIDFQTCWSLGNLRLLPASENCSKGAKLLKPFQPAFSGI